MPNKLFEALSEAPNKVETLIDNLQARMQSTISSMEGALAALLIAYLVDKLLTDETNNVRFSVENLLIVAGIDGIFQEWQNKEYMRAISAYIDYLGKVTNEMPIYYDGFASKKALAAIAADNSLINAALGIDASGNARRGSMMWEVWQATAVRQDLKNLVLSSIKNGQSLKDLTKSVKTFTVTNAGQVGRLEKYWRTYAYDTFNQVAELKNEQFRQELNLKWFIYTGDVINDSRDFCIGKAGKVFAVVEADTEWPKDPTLIGKSSGIPYTPRIDRGRWNCRHRIRYISEETAAQLDKAKVTRIKQKYSI